MNNCDQAFDKDVSHVLRFLGDQFSDSPKRVREELPRHIARLPLWSSKRLAYIAQENAIREVFRETARKAFGGQE
jgi:hypothetical protein